MAKTVESTLKYDESTGMPKLHLWDFENMVVGINNQKEYDTLMQLYEIADWVWTDGDKPTEYPNKINGKVYIEAADYFAEANYKENAGKKIDIKLKDFCKLQDIAPSHEKEINAWFDKYKPYRRSLGRGEYKI